MEPRLDRRMACETDWGPWKLKRSRRVWNLLQSNRATRSRAVQRRAAVWRQLVRHEPALQSSLSRSEWRSVPESVRWSDSTNSTDAMRGGYARWPERVCRLVEFSGCNLFRRIPASSQGAVR